MDKSKRHPITKPSIQRLARRAGVKSVSEECYPIIKSIIEKKIKNIAEVGIIVNNEHQTKTIMPCDIYESFKLIGENVSFSNELNTKTCRK